jgi:hypothetical protein
MPSSCSRKRVEDVVEQATEIGLDYIQFTLGDRYRIYQVVDHSPALFLATATALLTGAPRIPPRPLASG